MTEILGKYTKENNENKNTGLLSSILVKGMEYFSGLNLVKSTQALSKINNFGEAQPEEYKNNVLSKISSQPDLKKEIFLANLKIKSFKESFNMKTDDSKGAEIFMKNLSTNKEIENNFLVGMVKQLQVYNGIKENGIGEKTLEAIKNPNKARESRETELKEATKKELKEKENLFTTPSYDQKVRLKQAREGFLPPNEINKLLTPKEDPTDAELLTGLKIFQKRHDLTVDGRIGPKTGGMILKYYKETTGKDLEPNPDYKGKNFFSKGGFGFLKEN